MAEIRYYVATGGAAPFADWFAELDAVVGAKITRAIARMEQGQFLQRQKRWRRRAGVQD